MLKNHSANGPIQAAQYVRMSTEHQQYSIDNQSDWNRRYAEAHGMTIVRTYSDVESGVNIRDGLQTLLDEVEAGHAGYSAVLVYDVSRWGRFQDTDESAYYEFRCKRAGVSVHYCAEQFENNGGLLSSLLKSIKRSMAGEYSRELSAKVFAGQSRLVRLGFHIVGAAGYGLRRQLIDRDRNPKGLLAPGERKSIQTDRIVLVPGPPSEVKLITDIYRHYTSGWNMAQITRWINSRGLLTDAGTLWTKRRVKEILTNEKYIGTNVYNRQSNKVGGKPVYNPRKEWITCELAFTPIVSREQFAHARSVRLGRYKSCTDTELLSKLRALWLRTGFLTSRLVAASPDLPGCAVYADRFGSLTRAYELVRFSPKGNFEYTSANRRAQELRPTICSDVAEQLRSRGAEVEIDGVSGMLRINNEFTVAIIPAPSRHKTKEAGKYRWIIRAKQWKGADIALIVRLTPKDMEVLDYYCFPTTEVLPQTMKLSIRNDRMLDVYRFENLEALVQMAQRSPLGG